MAVCTPQSQPGLCSQASSQQLHGNEEMCSAGGSGYKISCSSVTCTNCSAFPKQSRAGQGRGSAKPGNLAMLQQTFIRKKKRGSSLQCPQNFKFLHQIMGRPHPQNQYQYFWETVPAMGIITSPQTNTTDLDKGWMTLFLGGLAITPLSH